MSELGVSMPKTPEQYLQEPYSRILTPNGDGSYVAEILEFHGCIAVGASPNEAIANLEKTALSWVAANLSHGIAIPEPFDNLDYAGRVALRLPRSYHRQASKMAERDGISLNQYLVNAVGEKLGAENLFSQLIGRFGRNLGASRTIHIHLQMSSVGTGAKVENTQNLQIPATTLQASNSLESRSYA